MQTSNAVDANKSQTGKDSAWIAYILHAVGYLSAMMLPAFIGLIVNYARRGMAQGGYLDSHHGWMIRTFWYGLLWYVLSLGVLVASAWPFVQAVIHGASNQGTVQIDWATIFSSIGAAVLGGTGFFVTWIWLIYRMVRGVYCLANSTSLP